MNRDPIDHGTRPRPHNDDPRSQPMGIFTPGEARSGYHMDLRGVAGSYGPPEEAEAWLALLVARRERVMPVMVLQFGLGAWQRSVDPLDDRARQWGEIAELVADWAVVDMDGYGRFVHHQPMPHTYRIDAGWHSAMSQALGVSLLVRHGYVSDAARASASLLDPDFGLVRMGAHGPILQEYPATPSPDVLNGWMWGLFGLYDLSIADGHMSDDARTKAARAFDAGVHALIAELPSYETGRGWSTYDRYPHRITNVASPFYHRLHVAMLGALARIASVEQAQELEAVAARWNAALASPVTRASAVARKVGFRLVVPRGRAA